MKVTLKKDTYNYFKNLIEGSGRKLIEEWKSYIDYDKNSDYWNDLYDKTYKEAEFSSAQMVAKLLRGEIEIEEKKEPTRFVFYKERGFIGSKVRRYYGSVNEATEGSKATWYDKGFSQDERHMEALETLGWKKISLEQAQKEDK